MPNDKKTTVILGGKGKTGRRVAQRLSARGLPVRPVSPSARVPFDWNDEATWAAALDGAGAVYITYYPDLAVPGAAEHVHRLTRVAVHQGVERLVLLAGRGEPQVHPAESAVRESGVEWTILECAFFSQNFSESVLRPVDDAVIFPAADVAEPFVDCDDIADCAVAALTEDGHAGETYELTGPRALTFAEATAAIAEVSGRALRYVPVTYAHYAALLREHMPADQVAFFVDLFQFLLDGHNALVASGVERCLGRSARDFRDYARLAADAWR